MRQSQYSPAVDKIQPHRCHIDTVKPPRCHIVAVGRVALRPAAILRGPAVLDMFRAKYGARDVQGYYPKQDVAVEIPLA